MRISASKRLKKRALRSLSGTTGGGRARTGQIRAMIDEGALGMIHALEANLSNPNGQNPRSGWRNDPAECPAGGMTGLGVHMVDNLQYLAGPAKRVSAFSKQLYAAGNLDDVTNIILEYESGPLGYITTCYVTSKQCTTSAHGTEASAWSEDEGERLYLQKKDENPEERDFRGRRRCARGGNSGIRKMHPGRSRARDGRQERRAKSWPFWSPSSRAQRVGAWSRFPRSGDIEGESRIMGNRGPGRWPQAPMNT